MTQAEALLHLQSIELGISQRQKRLEEIATLLAHDPLLKAAQDNRQQAETILQPLQAQSRKLEHEIQANATKIRETDEALYSGRVRNPKELQEMQHEIESLKRRNLELEDQLLGTMVEVEDAEGRLEQAQTELDQAQTEHTKNNQGLIEERTRLKTEGRALIQDREQAQQQVTPESQKVYQALKPRKNNQPVAQLINQSCSFCRVQQDLAVINEARKGQHLAYCASCGRILVYKSS
jgi:uncharacterized protein